jgi:hypothetical protein
MKNQLTQILKSQKKTIAVLNSTQSIKHGITTHTWNLI